MNETGKIDGCGAATVLTIFIAFTVIATWAGLSFLERGATHRKDQIRQLQKEVQELRDKGKR